MAILPSLPGISVTVHNGQGELPEYPDAEPDVVEDLESPSSVVVSNYIEAPPDGGPFWLKLSVEAPFKHGPNRIIFEFEGPNGLNLVTSCGLQNMKKGKTWEDTFQGYGDERRPIYRSFQFMKLKILPGDGQSDDISEAERTNMEAIGMLQVRVLLVKRKKQTGIPSYVEYDGLTATTATEKIAERKSISLGMTYIYKAIDAPLGHHPYTYTYIDGWNHPLAIFQFKYRSRADLQRLLLIEKTREPEQLPKEDLLPTLPITPMPSSAPSLTPAPRPFEELTFAEVRGLARKQYISFDKLSGDEIETLARQKHAEQTVYANDEVASLLFGGLTFAQVRSLAKKQYKSFDELNGDEIEGLARQGHSQELASPQAAIPGASYERNGQGKRTVSIKVEDADEDVVFVSATKKRK